MNLDDIQKMTPAELLDTLLSPDIEDFDFWLLSGFLCGADKEHADIHHRIHEVAYEPDPAIAKEKALELLRELKKEMEL